MTGTDRRLYLDHDASVPLLPEARDVIVAALDCAGNASSVHAEGRAARAIVDRARMDVASLVGAAGDAVVFTSGATEAAATCLTPTWHSGSEPYRFDRLAVLDTDHPCLREGGRFEPGRITRLPVDADGRMDLAALEAWCRMPGRGLLAFCVANSETGIVQPVADIAAVARQAGCGLVLDVVQMAGRLPVDLSALGADALILSAHKMGGPKGVGAFVLGSTERRPEPLLTGGAQETRQRAGTEAVSLIAGFGAAARIAAAASASCERLLNARHRIEAGLRQLDDRIVILGAGVDRLPQTVAFHHPGRRAETIQIAMDLAGIAVSAGSACSSGKVGSSHVLEALARAGANVDPAMGAVRVSFGPSTTDAEIDRFIAAIEQHWRRSGAAARESRAA